MHSPACSIHVSAARRDERQSPLLPKAQLIALCQPSGPRLPWVARVKGVDPTGRINVLGASAFRTAGLYAYARPSEQVALFVFDPNPRKDGWRFESWLCELDSMSNYYRLRRHIVANRNMGKPGDAVDAMTQCELETAQAFRDWLGGLL